MARPPSRRGSPGPNGCRSRPTPTCDPATPAAMSALARLGEDHPPGDRLEDARDGDVDLGIDGSGPTLDDDHRAAVQVADALTGVLARLADPDLQLVTRQQSGLH